MYERKARLRALVCLILVLAPLAVVAWQYVETREQVLARERQAAAQPAATPAAPPPGQEEVYVAPEPITYPLY